jgi:hypothetical protein
MQGPFLSFSSEQKLRIIVPKPVPLDSLGSLTPSCWAPFHEISVRKKMSRIFIPQYVAYLRSVAKPRAMKVKMISQIF